MTTSELWGQPEGLTRESQEAKTSCFFYLLVFYIYFSPPKSDMHHLVLCVPSRHFVHRHLDSELSEPYSSQTHKSRAQVAQVVYSPGRHSC